MLAVAFNISPDHAEYEAMKEEFFCNYERRMTQSTFAFAGVAEMISSIVSRGMKWGVVTNKSARFTDPLTRSMRLFSDAGAIVSGDTTPHSKPHPEPLFEAARRLDVPPQQCVYVGDDERDIIAGAAAGMPTVAACYGYLGNKVEIAAWGADVLIQTPLALLNHLAISPPDRA
jgi:phosphoglycolate phosphatase